VELINKLSQQCCSFITNQGYASTEEVAAYIRKSGGFRVEFRPDHIQAILEKLIYDGVVEISGDPRGRAFMAGRSAVIYKPTNLGIVAKNGFTQTPCGICPVFNQCSNEGEITPQKCIYMESWLEF